MAEDIDAAASNTWKKITIAKTNNEWQLGERVKVEREEIVGYESDSASDPLHDNHMESTSTSSLERSFDLLQQRFRKGSSVVANETEEQRARRLAKMSAYAARRLANEKPEDRQIRLARMSAYAARRLALESPDQRAKRLARMSAYAAKRLAEESPEKRAARLARMSAYAAKRQKIKKSKNFDQNYITIEDTLKITSSENNS